MCSPHSPIPPLTFDYGSDVPEHELHTHTHTHTRGKKKGTKCSTNISSELTLKIKRGGMFNVDVGESASARGMHVCLDDRCLDVW